MLVTISKVFRWEMGHRLPFHDGLCANLHGHSYQARVMLTGEPDARGMVMDYYHLKRIIQPIIDSLDHSFMVDSTDSLMKQFFDTNPMKTVVVDFPSTAENIAAYILSAAVEALSGYASIKEITIRVYETENTFAEVRQVIRKS